MLEIFITIVVPTIILSLFILGGFIFSIGSWRLNYMWNKIDKICDNENVNCYNRTYMSKLLYNFFENHNSAIKENEMPEIKDNILEEAMENFRKAKHIEKNVEKNKVDKHQQRALNSLKSMVLIARLRKNGWEWLQMAKKLNVSEQTIRNWAAGKNSPHPNNLVALKRLEEK